MQVRPLHDRVLVQRLEEGEQQVGGIIIPDSAKEKPQRGTVVAAGAGKVNDEGKRVAMDVKTGDTVLFGKYSGQDDLPGFFGPVAIGEQHRSERLVVLRSS